MCREVCVERCVCREVCVHVEAVYYSLRAEKQKKLCSMCSAVCAVQYVQCSMCSAVCAVQCVQCSMCTSKRHIVCSPHSFMGCQERGITSTSWGSNHLVFIWKTARGFIHPLSLSHQMKCQKNKTSHHLTIFRDPLFRGIVNEESCMCIINLKDFYPLTLGTSYTVLVTSCLHVGRLALGYWS